MHFCTKAKLALRAGCSVLVVALCGALPLLVAPCQGHAQSVECSTECPPGTRRASFDAVARGEAGVVYAAECETFCEPILTCKAPSLPTVTAESYRCEPLDGYSSISQDVEVDFGFVAAWDEAIVSQAACNCGDGRISDAEIGVDCGGCCLPQACDLGTDCTAGGDEDCKYGVCANGLCGGFSEVVEYQAAAGVSMPAGSIEQAELVDIDGDAGADLVLRTKDPRTLHLLDLTSDRQLAGVESTDFEAYSLSVAEVASGVVLTANAPLGSAWVQWRPYGGAPVATMLVRTGAMYGPLAPARIDDREVPMVVAAGRRAGAEIDTSTNEIVLIGFDGQAWAEASIPYAADALSEDTTQHIDQIFAIPSAADPRYDDVVLVSRAAQILLVARDASGDYAWHSPQLVGEVAPETLVEIFAFASQPGGPSDSIGAFQLLDTGYELVLFVTPNGAAAHTQVLGRSNTQRISAFAADLDGRGDLDSGVASANLRLSLDTPDGQTKVVVYETPQLASDRIVGGRHDLSGDLVLFGAHAPIVVRGGAP